MALHSGGGLRVLMTTDAVGGVWNYCVRLAAGLERYGVQIALTTMGPALNHRQREDLQGLPNVELHESTFKLEWMRDPWKDVDRAGQWLLDLERRVQPDLIHLNGYAHGALPWASPVLVVAHSCVCSWFEAVRKCEPTAEWGEYRRRVDRGLRRADLVTAPTAAALDMLGRHYGRFQSAGPIYNGCDPVDGLAPSSEEVVFCAGRLWDPAKNVAMLDRAAAEVRWPVYAAGETTGPDGQRIELNHIHGLGHLDQGSLWRWYRRAAVVVVPSLYEPFGLAALEAGLANRALVLSDIPTLREVWSDAAIFVAPEDHRGLARAVNRLIADATLRERYARHAGERARQYTLDRMVRHYRRLYMKLLRMRKSGLSRACVTPSAGGGDVAGGAS